jgi:hypothetical protein
MRPDDIPALAKVPRWTEPLRTLGDTLRGEAPQGRGRWVTYALPHGGLVSARDTSAGIEFRIARLLPDGACSLVQRSRWEHELAVFREHLGLADWPATPEADSRVYGHFRLAVRFTPPAVSRDARGRRTA